MHLKLLLFSATAKHHLYSLLSNIPFVRSFYRLAPKPDLIKSLSNRLSRVRGFPTRLIDLFLSFHYYSFGFDIGRLPLNIRSSLYRIFTDRDLAFNPYNELADSIAVLDSSVLLPKQWLNLYSLLCYSGQYSLALSCRNHALNATVQLSHKRLLKSQPLRPTHINALIEVDISYTAENLSYLLQHSFLNPENYHKWFTYVSVMSADGSYEPKYRDSDLDFAELVKGRTINIVGPSKQLSSAIDRNREGSTDLILQMNFSSKDISADSLSDVSITSFNGVQAECLLSDFEGELPASLKACLLKCPEHLLLVKRANPNLCVRSHTTFYETQFHGSFSLLPLILLDLCQFECAHIYVTNCDMMLSKYRKDNYYPSNLDEASAHINHSSSLFRFCSITHDPVQQYNIVHTLWSNGKVSGDEAFTYAMTLGLSKYLRELELIYALP